MKWVLAALILGASVHAQACEPDLAAKLFMKANDKNGDGVLTMDEWKNAKAGDLKLNVKAGDAAAFKKLDRNDNEKIEISELVRAVSFETSPCEGWPWQK